MATTTRAYEINTRVIGLLEEGWIWPATIVAPCPTNCQCGAPRYVLEWECDGCNEQAEEPELTADGDEIAPVHMHSDIFPEHDLTTWCEKCLMPLSAHINPAVNCDCH